MKKIILATDFTAEATKAETIAIKIAKKFIAEVTLLYCSSPTYVDPSIPSGMIANLEVEREKQFENKLAEKARKIQEQGVITKYSFSTGTVAEGINQINEQAGADLVILGKTGSTGLLDKLIGSTAEYVINNIKIPLLVVPEATKHVNIDEILYATELEYDENAILSEIIDVGKNLGANVNLVNIQSETQIDLTDDVKLIAKIKSSFPNETLHLRTLRSNKVDEAILNLAESKMNVALVVAAHHRGFLDGLLKPSMSKRIIAKTKVPTFVYHFE